jgi:asparagine synthase (glutamine-hydrolysing)
VCGIAGIVALNGSGAPTLEQLTRMAGALRHRGPDEFGAYRDARAGLAHARLSIIDLATGQQPLCNEQGTLWVVFNGEIFNYLELRAELLALGHRFRTRSDTEVVVHAFEAWGEGAFARFNGQFALALWDSRREVLVLARDPVGILPLYYCEHAGRLYFASEVKAIFAADRSIPRELDPAGLAESFTLWSVVPPQGVFRGVRELEPATVRTIEAGGSREAVYWRPGYAIGGEGRFEGSLEEATEAVRDALEQATRLRTLRADVPVGSYLSGGLDSSLTAAFGLAAKGERFQTFSMRFEDEEYDETRFQRLMVAQLGSEHHEVVIRRRDIAESFPEVIEHAERPILRTAPAPLFMLSGLVRQAGIKVVLTGEGADEMFAGYDLFREAKVRRFWARQPGSSWRPRLLERLYPYLARSPVSQRAMAREFFGMDLGAYRQPGFAHGPRWHSTASVRRLLRAELRREVEGLDVVARCLGSVPVQFASWSPLAQDQFLEVRTLLSGYLLSSQGDRMLMAHSVEGRFPFLDPNVMALADSLPDDYKLHVLDEKHVLKRVARGVVPEPIVARKKQPYRAPDALAFASPGDGRPPPAWVQEVLSERALREAGVFEPAAAQRLWRKCLAGRGEQFSNADNMALTGVLSTQLLHQRFVRDGARVGPSPKLDTLVDRLGNTP